MSFTVQWNRGYATGIEYKDSEEYGKMSFGISESEWKRARAFERARIADNCFYCLEGICKKHRSSGHPRDGVYACDRLFRLMINKPCVRDWKDYFFYEMQGMVVVYPSDIPEAQVSKWPKPFDGLSSAAEELLAVHQDVVEASLCAQRDEWVALINNFEAAALEITSRRGLRERQAMQRQDQLNGGRPFIYVKNLVLSGRRNGQDENWQGFRPHQCNLALWLLIVLGSWCVSGFVGPVEPPRWGLICPSEWNYTFWRKNFHEDVRWDWHGAAMQRQVERIAVSQSRHAAALQQHTAVPSEHPIALDGLRRLGAEKLEKKKLNEGRVTLFVSTVFCWTCELFSVLWCCATPIFWLFRLLWVILVGLMSFHDGLPLESRNSSGFLSVVFLELVSFGLLCYCTRLFLRKCYGQLVAYHHRREAALGVNNIKTAAKVFAFREWLKKQNIASMLEEMRVVLDGVPAKRLPSSAFEGLVAALHATASLVSLGDHDMEFWVSRAVDRIDWSDVAKIELSELELVAAVLTVVGTSTPFFTVGPVLEAKGDNKSRSRHQAVQRRVKGKAVARMENDEYAVYKYFMDLYGQVNGEREGMILEQILDSNFDDFYDAVYDNEGADYAEEKHLAGVKYMQRLKEHYGGEKDAKTIFDGEFGSSVGKGIQMMSGLRDGGAFLQFRLKGESGYKGGFDRYNDNYESSCWKLVRLDEMSVAMRGSILEAEDKAFSKIVAGRLQLEDSVRNEIVSLQRKISEFTQRLAVIIGDVRLTEEMGRFEGGRALCVGHADVEMQTDPILEGLTDEFRDRCLAGEGPVDVADQISMNRALAAIKLATGDTCTTFGEFCEGDAANEARVAGQRIAITDMGDSLIKDMANSAAAARDRALQIRSEKEETRASNKQLLQQLVIKPRMQLSGANLEAKVAGCNSIPHGVVAAIRWSDGMLSNGYFARLAGGKVTFLTHKHGTRPYVGEAVTFFSPDNEPCVTEVSNLFMGPSQEHFSDVLRVDTLTVPERVDSVKWSHPQPGDILRGCVAVGASGRQVRWLPMASSVSDTHIVGQRCVASLNTSTDWGYCRFAWFNRAGHLVGAHRYANVNIDNPDGRAAPGFDVDVGIGDPNFKWSSYKWGGIHIGVETGRESTSANWQTLEGLTTEESPGVAVATGLKPSHVAKEKTWRPNSALEFMHLCCCKHIVMKPAADEVVNEINKFDEAGNKPTNVDRCVVDRAVEAVALADAFSSMTYLPIRTRAGQELLATLVDGHLKPKSSSGVMGDGRSQKTYLTDLGAGDLLAGKRLFASIVTGIISNFEDGLGGPLPEYWTTFGKEDKYSSKKITAGDSRSIQGCSILMKTLWLYCFSLSDVIWASSKETPYEVSLNRNAPVRRNKVEAYQKAKHCYGYDVKQFDRAMPAVMMESFFQVYVPAICRNIPQGLVEFFQEATVTSLLVQPDGRVFQKRNGNPSGFPNTIRLNCIVLRAADAIAAEAVGKSGYRYSEFCGDDIRLFADDEALNTINAVYQQTFQSLFPWELTLEGNSVVDLEKGVLPDFVATTVVRYNERFYNVTADTSRQVAKLLYVKGPEKPEELAERVVGVVNAMVHNVVMHLGGRCYDPTVDFVLLNFYPHVRDRQELYNHLEVVIQRAGRGWC